MTIWTRDSINFIRSDLTKLPCRLAHEGKRLPGTIKGMLPANWLLVEAVGCLSSNMHTCKLERTVSVFG